MPMIFEKGDWSIHRNESARIADGHCLRHMTCVPIGGISFGRGGVCSCNGYCDKCKAEAPDEIKGFFALVKWKR